VNDYKELPEAEAEQAIYENLKNYDEDSRLRYAQIGLMVLSVQKRELWKLRIDPADGFPCRSLARWIRIACPYAYSTVYAALNDVEELQDMPQDVIAQVPQGNFKTLKQLSTKVRRDPEVHKVAKEKSEKLVQHIQKNYPEQAIEQNLFMRFSPTTSQRGDIQDALQHAKAGDSISDTEALWRVCVDYNLNRQTPLSEIEDERCGHV